MNRIGLALSGGGFRATLYHLGLTRFLRDANLLSQVTHITSVSGGSIFAAHLALNWDRYNGSPNEFDAAASELISLVRLDVRNRITRRFPLTIPFRWPLRLFGVLNRKLTRTGLLEHHYDRYLYGDISLFELPEKPQLHILATNLSEGCLCSFTRDGLLMVRRAPGNTFRIDRIPIGLATVPMAVTASSAFPGFFPPLELTGTDVGASVGEFGRQAFTDGGVFDNLGIRMFRCLERTILAEHPLSVDDFFDLPAVWKALQEASESTVETPLRRLAQALVDAAQTTEETPLHQLAEVLVGAGHGAGANVIASTGIPNNLSSATGTGTGDRQARILSSLSVVMGHYQFYHEPIFAHLKPVDPAAEAMLHAVHAEGRLLNAADQLWLNRQMLESAFRSTTGRACFRRLSGGLDGVIVSDVGKPIEVTGARRAGGVIRTALRASDILMDRVWQLEHETFQNGPGFIFAPITEVVEPTQDATAMHPEVQRQMANIRTDLDRFSLLEISGLVRHGYCVGRKVCQSHPELFGIDLPRDPPWDPVSTTRGAARASSASAHAKAHFRGPTAPTLEARTLQASAVRRIWSSLFDLRDWTSYLYLPLVLAILILLPRAAFKYYQKTQRAQLLINWLYQGNKDMAQIERILAQPAAIWPPGSGAIAETRSDFNDFTNVGFKVVEETRIIDLRLWDPAHGAKSIVQYFRGARVLKESEGNDIFFVKLMAAGDVQVRFPPQKLSASLVKTPDMPGPNGTQIRSWGVAYDFSHVPQGHIVSISAFDQSPAVDLQGETIGESHMSFELLTDTAELSMWILMPKGRAYHSWTVTRVLSQEPERVEQVEPIEDYLSVDSTIIGFQLASVKRGERYEVSWSYR